MSRFRSTDHFRTSLNVAATLLALAISAGCSATDAAPTLDALDALGAGSSTEPASNDDSTSLATAPAVVRPAGAPAAEPSASIPVGSRLADGSIRPANELGRVMVLEYHLIGEEGRWTRDPERLRQDFHLLYERGYRPVSVAEFMDDEVNLPEGLSPVIITFDDASPSQFRYIEEADGSLTIDPSSAVGVWMEFGRNRPEWRNRAVFCLLPAAEAGRAFFGDKNIEGQKTEWRFQKVRFLADQGFELCNHTLWHANLGRYDDAFVQEQIARGVMAIDSVVPGYRVRTFALPLGIWPKNRELAYRGSWTDPRSGKVVSYDFDAVLEVAGGPTRSRHDSTFTAPARLNRVQVYGDELELTLDRLERAQRYVSDGRRGVIARPPNATAGVR